MNYACQGLFGVFAISCVAMLGCFVYGVCLAILKYVRTDGYTNKY